MIDERARRTAAAAREAGGDLAILTSAEAVCYATGLDVSVEWGASPFLGGPLTALVAGDGSTALVVGNLEEPAARASRADVVRSYEGFSDVRQPPLERNYLAAVAAVVQELGLGGVAAIEPHAFPVSLRDALAAQVRELVDIRPALDRMRATKTAAEIELLRRNAEIAALGQQAALGAVAPGRRELEIFADIRCAIELAAGERVAITGDLISGVDRTAACEGWPNDRLLEPGDPVICDLAPRIGGYWGDSCNTIVAGEPTPGLAALREVSARALERAAETLRPGLSAGAFDAIVREVITAAGYTNPLHIGHSIGTAIHEHPRLVAEETAVLEPDMVLMVEPGAYVEGVGGVRLEWMFRVTETGNEVLCPFEHVFCVPAALTA